MAYNPGSYDRAHSQNQYDYSRNSATNAYGRFLSQQRGQRDLGDTTRGFKRQMPGFQSSFNQRGLAGSGVGSGVQQGAMQRFLGDYYTDYGRQQQDLTGQLQQYDRQQADFDANYQRAGADIEAQRAADRATSASNIEALKAFLGGL